MNQNDQAQAALARYEEILADRALLHTDYEDARAEPYEAIASAVAGARAEIAALEASILPAVLAIEEQYADRLAAAEDRLDVAETDVRTAILAYGASMKGTMYHAVYTKGRTSWDSKGLDGYAVAYPEVLRFRSVGEPSVSIRAAK